MNNKPDKHSERVRATTTTSREQQLRELAASAETDAAECAASDLFKEFSTSD